MHMTKKVSKTKAKLSAKSFTTGVIAEIGIPLVSFVVNLLAETTSVASSSLNASNVADGQSFDCKAGSIPQVFDHLESKEKAKNVANLEAKLREMCGKLSDAYTAWQTLKTFNLKMLSYAKEDPAHGPVLASSSMKASTVSAFVNDELKNFQAYKDLGNILSKEELDEVNENFQKIKDDAVKSTKDATFDFWPSVQIVAIEKIIDPVVKKAFTDFTTDATTKCLPIINNKTTFLQKVHSGIYTVKWMLGCVKPETLALHAAAATVRIVTAKIVDGLSMGTSVAIRTAFYVGMAIYWAIKAFKTDPAPSEEEKSEYIGRAVGNMAHIGTQFLFGRRKHRLIKRKLF